MKKESANNTLELFQVFPDSAEMEQQGKASWHIHIDGQQRTDGKEPLSEDFREVLRRLGFEPDNFLPQEATVGEHAPEEHWTWKGVKSQAAEFKVIIANLNHYLEAHPEALRGYVEAEYIPVDHDYEDRPEYKEGVSLPFVITDFMPLQESEPDSPEFRETEIHISLDSSSDPRLLENFRQMGLYEVHMPKDNGARTAIIFTIQGTRQMIKQMIFKLHDYLKQVGGYTHCSIKEERIVHYQISAGARVPPIANDIEELLAT